MQRDDRDVRVADPPAHGTALLPWAIAAVIAAATCCVYWGVGGFSSINMDDGTYVYRNPHVLSGLTVDGLRWAFTAFHAGNWHPVTWLSHMADISLFGPSPGWHHRVNVAFHVGNATLLFLLVRASTGSTWRSAVVALLFVVHPLRVESVAWIAERKDVLSTFFGLLAMLAYLGYVRRPGGLRYAVVGGCLGLALLGKPMLVTLPVLLLLLDVWPLDRLHLRGPPPDGLREFASRSWPLLEEKIPLLAAALATCVAAYLAQSSARAVSGAQLIPVGARIENALVSYVAYLGKAIVPTHVAPVYPHPALAPGGIPAWQVIASVLLLTGVTCGAIRLRRSRPYLLVGWLWFLVGLLPAIGLVQVGSQGMADRYTYLPLVGPTIAVTWWIGDWAKQFRIRVAFVGAVAAAVIAMLALTARARVSDWHDSRTLFTHALSVTTDNWMAWRNLGVAQYESGQYGDAIQSFQESLRIMPSAPDTWVFLAVANAVTDHADLALRCFSRALELGPDNPQAWFNLALFAYREGDQARVDMAAARLRQLDPELAAALDQKMRAARVR